MAFIGVIDKRDGYKVTVRLHGPRGLNKSLDEIQLKNFVTALVSKHTTVPLLARDTYELCNLVAKETIDVYGNRDPILWAECNVETDNGYLAGVIAERDDI